MLINPSPFHGGVADNCTFDDSRAGVGGCTSRHADEISKRVGCKHRAARFFAVLFSARTNRGPVPGKYMRYELFPNIGLLQCGVVYLKGLAEGPSLVERFRNEMRTPPHNRQRGASMMRHVSLAGQ